jgi:hypothetical protein
MAATASQTLAPMACRQPEPNGATKVPVAATGRSYRQQTPDQSAPIRRACWSSPR